MVDNERLARLAKDITLDLCGHKLSFTNSDFRFYGSGAALTLLDSSASGSGVLAFSDGYCLWAGHYAKITVNSGTISSQSCGVYLYDYGEFEMNNGALLVSGAESRAIFGDGTLDDPTTTKNEDNGHTKIVINGGIIESECESEVKDVTSVAIYQPQSGSIEIYDGSDEGEPMISGGTGITMLAGTLYMEGGTIMGSAYGDPEHMNDFGANGNGSAICAISDDDFAGGIEIDITGGVLTSRYTYALYEYRYDDMGTEDTADDLFGDLVDTNVISVVIAGAFVNAPTDTVYHGFDAGVVVMARSTIVRSGADTEVRASTAPSYTVIIPALIDFGTLTKSMSRQEKEFAVSIFDAVFADGMRLVVTANSSSGFKMTVEGGSNQLAYELGVQVFEFTNAMADDCQETLTTTISTLPSEVTAAGEYSDTMVFTISYEAEQP